MIRKISCSFVQCVECERSLHLGFRFGERQGETDVRHVRREQERTHGERRIQGHDEVFVVHCMKAMPESSLLTWQRSDQKGRIATQCSLCRSFVELANEELDDAKADELIDNMFKSPSYGTKDSITFEDFSRLLSDYEKELNYASLEWSGTLQRHPLAPCCGLCQNGFAFLEALSPGVVIFLIE